VRRRTLLFGALAGAAGTAAKDLAQYTRYRQKGGAESLWSWESAETVSAWDQASSPGQVGRKLETLLTRHSPPDGWARRTTNVMHWATGTGWGLQYGVLAGKARPYGWMLPLALGPTAWATSYVVLPLVKVYKPIWEYDARTLGEDLSAHLVYGIVTGAVFAALSRALAAGGR
jgi:hypothetical protein